MALEVFTSARAGLQATRGTPATPTRALHGTQFNHDQTIATIRPEILTGLYEGHPSAATGVETNTFGYPGFLSFDEAAVLGNLFIAPLGTASGTTISGGTAYTYTFTPSGTADNIKTMTVQMARSDTILTAPGVALSDVIGATLNLHWEKNDDGAATFDANFLTAGTASQLGTFTGAAADTAQVLAQATATSVYLDATTIGTTIDTAVISVDWTLNLNPVPLYTLNGSAGATAVYRPQHRTWSATIVRQYSNATEWSIYQTKAERKMRIRTLGPALAGVNQKIDLDLYGVYTGRTWSDVDGIITEELTMENYTDPGLGTASFGMVVVTTLGTLA